jgi:hypothetical protein
MLGSTVVKIPHLCYIIVIWQIQTFFPQNMATSVITFPQKKTLYESHNTSFCCHNEKIPPRKERLNVICYKHLGLRCLLDKDNVCLKNNICILIFIIDYDRIIYIYIIFHYYILRWNTKKLWSADHQKWWSFVVRWIKIICHVASIIGFFYHMIIRIKRSSGNITMFKGDIGCKHLVFVIEFSLDLYLFITLVLWGNYHF